MFYKKGGMTSLQMALLILTAIVIIAGIVILTSFGDSSTSLIGKIASLLRP